MENKNLVDIPEYDNYKFDLELHKVYSIKYNKYLKNHINNKGYYQVGLYKNGKEKKYKIHRLVYMCNNPTEDISLFAIDHIDCDTTNNNIENLRKATTSQNSSNAKTYITNKLGVKYISETRNSFRFRLVKNKIAYEKYFKNLQDAIEYRDIKVKEINGEYANLG